jgi:uncharacterized protein YecE (DUF72 family)
MVRRSPVRPKFDELTYYADTVEINNTFYRPPTARTAQSWADPMPSGSEFSLKLLQDTYKRQVTQADVERFKRGIEPLADAARSGLCCVSSRPASAR